MNQKGFVPILILLLVATALLGGYFIYQKQNQLTPSPQPSSLSTEAPSKEEESTANWKIYKNTGYGFGFQYPASFFELSEKNNPTPKIKLSLRLNQIGYGSDWTGVTIDVTTDSEQNIVDFTDVSLDQKEFISVDGVQANQYAGFGGIGGDVYNEVVIIPKNGLNYYFHLGTLDNDNKNLLNKILATFKFLP